MTVQTQAILSVLLGDAAGRHYGLEIAQAAGIATGSLYPALARLEREGWVTSSWEQIDQHQACRPRRRYYRLTAHGAACAEQALADTIRRLSPARDAPVRSPAVGARLAGAQ